MGIHVSSLVLRLETVSDANVACSELWSSVLAALRGSVVLDVSPGGYPVQFIHLPCRHSGPDTLLSLYYLYNLYYFLRCSLCPSSGWVAERVI